MVLADYLYLISSKSIGDADDEDEDDDDKVSFSIQRVVSL